VRVGTAVPGMIESYRLRGPSETGAEPRQKKVALGCPGDLVSWESGAWSWKRLGCGNSGPVAPSS
jgi:hypothetical protein